jgi:hypothetical protein
MKRYILALVWALSVCVFGNVYAQENASVAAPAAPLQAPAAVSSLRIILLIAEQNIDGPQRAWWASEIDLSATEAMVAGKLIEKGFTVVDPASAKESLSQQPAFRVVSITDDATGKLASAAGAEYAVVGKAVATSGGNIPQSSMRSCFANVSAKLIRVRDGKVLAYLSTGGNSAHLDVVTGGREALEKAGEALALKISEALAKEGGK